MTADCTKSLEGNVGVWNCIVIECRSLNEHGLFFSQATCLCFTTEIIEQLRIWLSQAANTRIFSRLSTKLKCGEANTRSHDRLSPSSVSASTVLLLFLHTAPQSLPGTVASNTMGHGMIELFRTEGITRLRYHDVSGWLGKPSVHVAMNAKKPMSEISSPYSTLLRVSRA